MSEIVQTIGIVLFLGLWLFAAVKVAVRMVRSKCGKLRTVKAKVIDKNKIEVFDKYKGNGKHTKYVIVFETEGKKRSFYVSEFSYGGYRVGETGTLTYRGDRIVSFQ